MASSILLSDNGATSGISGIKQTGGDDGSLLIQTTTSGGTPTTALTISDTQTATFASTASATKLVPTGNITAGNGMYLPTTNTLAWSTNGSERMRIDSSGALLVGATDNTFNSKQAILFAASGAETWGLSMRGLGGTTQGYIQFINSGGGGVGVITQNGGANVAYVTSSDYRLKHDIQPVTGALAKVAALKPCTYKWNADDSAGEGFIAHELQEVCPSAVVGEKDAVDAEGKPVYQGIDTSFLVATLTAAIQELKTELDEAKERIAALEAK